MIQQQEPHPDRLQQTVATEIVLLRTIVQRGRVRRSELMDQVAAFRDRHQEFDFEAWADENVYSVLKRLESQDVVHLEAHADEAEDFMVAATEFTRWYLDTCLIDIGPAGYLFAGLPVV